MTRRSMSRPTRLILTNGIVILAAGLVLAAILWGRTTPAQPTNSNLLDEPLPGPTFALVDHTGQPITDRDVNGRVWVADFMLTRCVMICPVLTHRMGQVRDAVEDDPSLSEVQLVSFSVDPEHDTVEVLRDYAQERGAIAPRWRLVTGELDAIRSMSETVFKMAVHDLDADASEREGTPVMHGSQLVLLDRAGQIRGFYNGMQPDQLPVLLADVRRLIAEDNPTAGP